MVTEKLNNHLSDLGNDFGHAFDAAPPDMSKLSYAQSGSVDCLSHVIFIQIMGVESCFKGEGVVCLLTTGQKSLSYKNLHHLAYK